MCHLCNAPSGLEMVASMAKFRVWGLIRGAIHAIRPESGSPEPNQRAVACSALAFADFALALLSLERPAARPGAPHRTTPTAIRASPECVRLVTVGRPEEMW